MKLKMIDSQCEWGRSDSSWSASQSFVVAMNEPLLLAYSMCRYSVFTHTQRASFTFFLHSQFYFLLFHFVAFFSFASLTRLTLPSAMVDTKERENNEEREKLITFLFIIHRMEKKLAGSDLFPLSSLSHCWDKFIRSHELRNDYKTLSSPHAYG